MSVEEYLKFDESSSIKHEYVAGEVFAMSGPNLRHNLISLNLARAFFNHLQGGPCQAFAAEIKVRLRIETREFFYYPDVVVACGPLNMEERYLHNPRLIVEVLSPSTESIDRREKALNYQRIASLVMISSGLVMAGLYIGLTKIYYAAPALQALFYASFPALAIIYGETAYLRKRPWLTQVFILGGGLSGMYLFMLAACLIGSKL